MDLIADYFADTASRAYTPRVGKKLVRVLENCIQEGIYELVDNDILARSQTVGMRDITFQGLLPSVSREALSSRYRDRWAMESSRYLYVYESLLPLGERLGPRFRKRLDESIAGILSFYDQRDTLALMVGKMVIWLVSSRASH